MSVSADVPGPLWPPGDSALDNPIWSALTGPLRPFGTVTEGVAHFDPDVAPFGAFDGRPTGGQWQVMAGLVGAGGTVTVMGDGLQAPLGWSVVGEGPGVQMVCERLSEESDKAARGVSSQAASTAVTLSNLGPPDVADMLALVGAARPGPFRDRTHELGGYVGIREGGRLVAMAGERLRVPGYTEISAVATLPSHRRRGLATMLIRRVARGIIEDGSVPFLHAAADNEAAIWLYTTLGFRLRQSMYVRFLRASAGTP
jgi:ribosomal protein S18 acetylase RimI-like enzyme